MVRLVQKALVLLQAQNKCIKISGSSWQRVHWSVSLILIFFKKLLVAIRLCIHLKWKLMGFVHLVYCGRVFCKCLSRSLTE